MIVLLLVGLGLIFGSFVNAFVERIHEGRDWVKERSQCPHCHHVLGPADLVPVFSWLLLRGKCRYCHKPIPDSPIIEALLPVFFVVSYLNWPEPFHGAGLFAFVLWLIFLVGFMILAVYDLKWFLLPDKVVFPFIGLAIFQVLGTWVLYGGNWRDVVGSVIGAFIISGLFLLIFIVSKGKWIGFGDVKLGVMLGLLAGAALPALLVLFLASLLGMVWSLPMVLAGRASRKSHLPFGPLLLAGLFIVVLFGQQMINWYSRLVLGV